MRLAFFHRPRLVSLRAGRRAQPKNVPGHPSSLSITTWGSFNEDVCCTGSAWRIVFPVPTTEHARRSAKFSCGSRRRVAHRGCNCCPQRPRDVQLNPHVLPSRRYAPRLPRPSTEPAGRSAASACAARRVDAKRTPWGPMEPIGMVVAASRSPAWWPPVEPTRKSTTLSRLGPLTRRAFLGDPQNPQRGQSLFLCSPRVLRSRVPGKPTRQSAKLA